MGSEIGGKSNKFTRPVIIFRKLSHGFYFVIPTSTKEKDGSWYVKFTQQTLLQLLAYIKLEQLIIVGYSPNWEL